MRILILGSTGMLGRAVSNEFENLDAEVVALSRASGFEVDERLISRPMILGGSRVREFDWIINCIGVTKTHIDPKSPESVKRATIVNSVFPNLLADEARSAGVKVLQVATDCVYSGAKGFYVESDDHDPLDVYGKTKSLGEAKATSIMHLRCSLVGPEASGKSTLFYEWLRNLESGTKVRGFTNHYWNGLTSEAFARIAAAIVTTDLFHPGIQHLVPADTLSKFDLVRLILEKLGREDVSIEAFEHETRIDRTLSTENQAINDSLFAAAGFETPPPVSLMLEGLACKPRE